MKKLPIIYTTSVFIFMALLFAGVYISKNQPIGAVEISLEQTLKAPIEKIISQETVTVIKCIEYNESISATSTPIKTCKEYSEKEVKNYKYISEVEVKADVYNGIDEDMSMRTDGSKSFRKPQTIENGVLTNHFETVIPSGEPFKKVDDKWYQTETATTTPDIFNEAIKVSLLQILFGKDVYADISTTTAHSSDGYFGRWSSTWASCRDTTSAEDVDPWGGMQICNHSNPQIVRTSNPFDTSGIDDGADIDEVKLKLTSDDYHAYYDNNADSIVTVIHTRATDTTLATTDYDIATKWGATELADRFDFSSWTQTGDTLHTITFNSDGRNAIVDDGYTIIGLLASGDYDNTGAPSTSAVGWYPSEETGTDKDPTLVVTWSAAAPIEDEPVQSIIWFE